MSSPLASRPPLATATATGTGTGSGAASGTADAPVGERIASSAEGMWESLVAALPRVGVALVIMVVAWLVARVVRRVLQPRLTRARTKSFGRVFATLAYVGIILAGLFVALPVLFPSVDAVTMLSGLGVVGIAAGFAFQDILSNLLAGLLLILRQPFQSGDQISVNDITGTVDVITIRETRIIGFDGRLVFVPNKDVYTNAIEVQTGRDAVRTSLLVGVDYDADLGQARRVALDTLARIDGVRDDPAPQAYYTEFAASSITLDLRYWTDPHQAEIRAVQDRVVERIKAAYDEAGIGIPFDIVTLDAAESFAEAVAARDRQRAD